MFAQISISNIAGNLMQQLLTMKVASDGKLAKLEPCIHVYINSTIQRMVYNREQQISQHEATRK